MFAIAIMLHKGAAGLSLGISMVNTFPDEKRLVMGMIFIFAIMSPLGIGLGMALQGQDEIVEIVFSSLSAGTFLYISCSEVIVEEFSIPHFKYLKLLFFVAGVALITSLFFLEPSD